MYEKTKAYVIENFEHVFVLVVLVAVLFIVVFIPYKLAMLHFFYVPVMLTGFMLGRKKALQGAVAIMLVAVLYAMISYAVSGSSEENWDEFTRQWGLASEIVISVGAWGAFLLLTGYTVGLLRDRIVDEKQKATQLNVELKKMFEAGQKAFLDKKQFGKEMEGSRKKLEEIELALKGMKEKMLENLLSTMDPNVANLIFEKKLQSERRELSVLSASLTDFGNYVARKQPRTVVRTVGHFLSEMEQLLNDYHGHIEGYTGGEILCEFGAPVEYETHPLLAVMAALRMQERVRKLKLPWVLQVGISTGTAVTGLVGSKRKSYTALGYLVSRARHLQAACRPGKVLVDGECYSKINHCIEARLVREVPGAQEDHTTEMIDKLESKYAANSEDVETLYHLGLLYFKKLHQPARALRLFEQALRLDPDNTDLKLAYAEANIQKDSDTRFLGVDAAELTAYEVVGTRNPLMDESRLPRKFAKRYSSVEKHVGVPPDLILPIEAADGSVGHSLVVAILSYAIAETLGLNEAQKKDVLMAGYIQDIGKKLIPDYIISRTQRLTEKEMALVRRHPVEAVRILASAGLNKKGVLEIVENHHERFNGKGYPRGKAGQQIPIGARITAVADSYDAMVAWRPHKKRMDRTSALDELKDNARAGLYDPAVIEALMTLLDSE